MLAQQGQKTVCPSGLRGWTQVPLAQAAWVQIPQLSFSLPRRLPHRRRFLRALLPPTWKRKESNKPKVYENASCKVRTHALADWRLKPAPSTARPNCLMPMPLPCLPPPSPPHLFSRKLPPSLNHTRRYAKWVIKNQISKHARGHEFHWNVERSNPRSKPPMERRPLLGAPPTAGPQQKYTPCGTRARNLRIRSPTPCPLGQGGH